MKRTFLTLILAVLATATISAQQNVVQNKELDSFSSVIVGGKFSFKLKTSPTYSVRIVSDERIADFVRPTVKNGVFTIILDEKKYPAELKKALKAKGAVEPYLEVEIYAPYIKSLDVKEKAVLLDSDGIKVDNFSLVTSGNAKVNSLYIDCVSAELDFGGGSQSNVTVDVDTKLRLSAENTSVNNVNQKGGNSELNVKGSSTTNLKVETVGVDIEAAGGSNVYISGIASLLDVDSAGSSMIDAEALEVKEGNFLQSGSSKCHVNVEDRMRVNLTGGCMLTFKRTPRIEVERIVNSTLIKADDPKRK